MIDFIVVISCAVVCAFLYALKGGDVAKRLPYGRITSSILFGVAIALVNLDIIEGLLAGVGWGLGVSPSLGEEAGAVGGFKGAWGEYIEKGFGRSYGIKHCLQRGVWTGAMIALGLQSGFTGLIVAGAAMVPLYWIGISIRQLPKNVPINQPWDIGEWLYGAALGVAVGLTLI